MLHNLAVLSASSLLEYLNNQLAKPIVIEDIVQPVTINEDGEEEYESISQMPSQTSRTSQVQNFKKRNACMYVLTSLPITV